MRSALQTDVAGAGVEHRAMTVRALCAVVTLFDALHRAFAETPDLIAVQRNMAWEPAMNVAAATE